MKRVLPFFLALLTLSLFSASCGVRPIDGTDKAKDGAVSGGGSPADPNGEIGVTGSGTAPETEGSLPDVPDQPIDLPSYFAEAIRAAYDLLPGEPITDDMIASVKKVNFRIRYYSEVCYVITGINNSPFETVLPYYWRVNRMEGFMRRIREAEEKDSPSARVPDSEKFSSFMTLKDKDNPELTARDVGDLIEKFPLAAEIPFYVMDPNIKSREKRELVSILAARCPDWMRLCMPEDGILHLESLDALPNLEEIELYTGFDLRYAHAAEELFGDEGGYGMVSTLRNDMYYAVTAEKQEQAGQAFNEYDSRIQERLSEIPEDFWTNEIYGEIIRREFGCAVQFGKVPFSYRTESIKGDFWG